MKNVTITEATGFQPGGVHQMLLNMGVPPIVSSLPGESPVQYKTQMTDAQIDHFRLRGFSHRLEVEETPVVDPRDARIAQLTQERDNWQATAEQAQDNTEYYRGLVQEIGGMLGDEAYTDDGSKSDAILCAKVPELVGELLDSMAAAQLMIADLQAKLQAKPGDPAAANAAQTT